MIDPGVDAWFVADGLSKRYGGIQAVQEASASLRPGEVRGLIGANGAGKSTFVKMLTGQVSPDNGIIRLDGSAVDLSGRGQGRRHGVELMPQELAILPNLSVADNVVLGREPHRGGFLAAKDAHDRAHEALARVGADSLDLDLPAGELGLVNQRLLMAARAIMSGSRLIVLDEPTAAMSPQEVTLLMEMVRALSTAGVSCMYVSHRLDEIIELADSVTAMRDGRVIEELQGDQITHQRLVRLITAAAPVALANHRPERVQSDEIVLEVTEVSGRTLTDASFAVARGEVVGLAGLIASGVDEVLGIVAGTRKPSSGDVHLLGRQMPLGSRKAMAGAGIGYLPGDRTLAALPNHRVRENVTVASLDDYATLGLPSPKKERQGIGSILERVGFRRSTEVTISTLSGGNQQKALFARWVIDRLQLLLLDDPTVGVDIGARAEIHQELREVVAKGVSVILYSSDVDELIALSDRVLVFDRGRIVTELRQPHVTAEEVLQAMTGAVSTPSLP